MNHPLYMSYLETAELVRAQLQENPVLKAGSWEKSPWSDRVVRYGKSRYEAFRNLEIFRTYTGKNTFAFTRWASGEADLRRHLMRQLENSGLEGRAYVACEYLIRETDDRGYLRYDPAAVERLCHANHWELELAEGMLRAMEPAGVGTESLEACLRKQREEGVPEIPKPGIRYSDRVMSAYVVPDVLIRSWNGQAQVMLNVTGCDLPVVDNRYRTLIPDIAEDRRKMHYLSQCYEDGAWLVRALENRMRVLRMLGEAIASCNRNFFTGRSCVPQEVTFLRLYSKTGIAPEHLREVIPGKYIQYRGQNYSMEYFLA